MKTRDLILSISAATLVLTTATAQAITYDDFNGAAIDRAKWFQFGDTTKSTQAGGSLRLFGRGFRDEFGVFALNGLQGDFDIVLKFTGFRAGGLEGGFGLFAFDSDGVGANERELSVGMTTTRDASGKAIVGFDGELVRNGTFVGGGRSVSPATAGEVRMTRVGKSAALYFRAAGQNNFTLLGSPVVNFFVGDTVSFGIEIQADIVDGADVFCDKITYSGRLVSGVGTYGKRCHGLGGVPLGYPRIGNGTFRMIVLGGAAFRADPFSLAIGLQQVAVPLAVSGAPGCSLYMTPLVVIPGGPLDQDGEGRITLPIPNDTTLRGIEFKAQFVANTNRNAMGLAWSNGITCKIF